MAYALAMWDHSVFSRRFGDEAEFADWDRCLDGLVERGYDCIRIDAWPHLLDSTSDEFTLVPQRKRWMWGNHTPVSIHPKTQVRELIEKAVRRDIKIGLSSWFQPDTSGHRARVRTPEDYARVWSRTLEHLSDFHDHILWVDLCNEFPLAVWSPSAWRDITHTRWPNIVPLLRPFRVRERRRMEAYFGAIEPLRARWPKLRYTVSFQDMVGSRNFRQLNLSSFDLLEVHVWLSNDPGFLLASGQSTAVLELPGSGPLHRFLGPLAWRGAKPHWVRALARRMDAWGAASRSNGNLPLYNSEGWASTMYVDARHSSGREWRWVKEACAAAIELAIERGWEGICTSNFCQPSFPGMWNDIQWHREMTSAIRSAASSARAGSPDRKRHAG